MLGRRLRRQPNIKTTLGECPVFAGSQEPTNHRPATLPCAGKRPSQTHLNEFHEGERIKRNHYQEHPIVNRVVHQNDISMITTTDWIYLGKEEKTRGDRNYHDHVEYRDRPTV